MDFQAIEMSECALYIGAKHAINMSARWSASFVRVHFRQENRNAIWFGCWAYIKKKNQWSVAASSFGAIISYTCPRLIAVFVFHPPAVMDEFHPDELNEYLLDWTAEFDHIYRPMVLWCKFNEICPHYLRRYIYSRPLSLGDPNISEFQSEYRQIVFDH